MSELYKINVKLSDGQKRKLAKAYRDDEKSQSVYHIVL